VGIALPPQPQRFYYGRDARGNLAISITDPERLEVTAFRCSARPQFRFPLWATWSSPDALFWLKDADLPALCLHLQRQGIAPERSPLEIHNLLFVHWRKGLLTFWSFPRGPNEDKFEIRFGFEGMPPAVAASLHRGEMRKVQAICGWREIRFHEGTDTPAFGLGADGSEWFFGERGQLLES
jgi:hypothetical protein